MATVELRNVTRSYGALKVVDDVSLSIEEGAFVSLLGPSGCGKTTTLRMVAGLDEPTGGEISIGGKVVSAPARGVSVPPEHRELGMVFQSYALWPHMTVGDNVSYPLTVRGITGAPARAKVEESLGMVHLTGLGNRYPHELSGGQQQRVALARALSVRPRVLLLDEPLSNLDASLREQLRFEIKDLQLNLGVTVIFVTHDQAEAFAVSDRIVVMRSGRILQVGKPEDLYRKPASTFVAGFLGVANQSAGSILGTGRVKLEDPVCEIDVPEGEPGAPGTTAGESVEIVVRPEAVDLVQEGGGAVPGVIEMVTFLGDRIDYRIRVGSATWRVNAPPPAAFGRGAAVGLRIREASVYPRGTT